MAVLDSGGEASESDEGEEKRTPSPPSVSEEEQRRAFVSAGGTVGELVEAFDDWKPALVSGAAGFASVIDEQLRSRSVDVNPELDEDAFFSTVEGHQTVANRYDLEKAVPMEKKQHFEEVNRYWVNKPYSYVVIFRSRKENETKYYLIEPHLTPIEQDLREFIAEKLRSAIKYESDDVLGDGSEASRIEVIEAKTYELLRRYDLYKRDTGGLLGGLFGSGGEEEDDEPSAESDDADDGSEPDDGDESGGLGGWLSKLGFGGGSDDEKSEGGADTTRKPIGPLDGLTARPEPAVIEEDSTVLSEYQVEKLLYYLRRDFIGYEKIDGIKHDINVEDISCDGYNSPVFVYHGDYENIITNVFHGKEELDEFVVKLAQRSGKGISKRQPQVDATLPDGSRSQLTLGQEVSDHGTNYTIRQFKDVPFTPIDLINWRTFSLDQMAYLWLAIENNKSLIFAGGTASGKTTSLNAVSLFIPSNAKIVSIEDTREVELPQRNWIASVTRPSFSDDDKGDIDEFDLLEAALRQRPDYIVMGEIRGEEGRTLFQVMSTGHTTYTTFHADSVGEVLKRFTTEPINVSKTLFTALDLVSIQRQTRLRGRKVRRSMSITEINEYNAEHDEINVQDVFQWRAEADEFDQVGQSNVLDTITFDRGWSHEDLQMELFKRRVVLAYLIRNSLNEYAQVAATVQAFISDPDTVLGLMANDALGARLEDLRSMESVEIDIEPEKESLVPRPDPDDEIYELTGDILDEADDHVFGEYRDEVPDEDALVEALSTTAEAGPAEPSSPQPSGTDAADDGPAGGLSVGGGAGDGEGLDSAATDLFSEFEQRAETAEADGGSEQPTETAQED